MCFYYVFMCSMCFSLSLWTFPVDACLIAVAKRWSDTIANTPMYVIFSLFEKFYVKFTYVKHCHLTNYLIVTTAMF